VLTSQYVVETTGNRDRISPKSPASQGVQTGTWRWAHRTRGLSYTMFPAPCPHSPPLRLNLVSSCHRLCLCFVEVHLCYTYRTQRPIQSAAIPIGVQTKTSRIKRAKCFVSLFPPKRRRIRPLFCSLFTFKSRCFGNVPLITKCSVLVFCLFSSMANRVGDNQGC